MAELSRQTSILGARVWLAEHGFTDAEVMKLEDVLNKSDLGQSPEQWLATLRGLGKEELIQIVAQAGDTPEPESPPEGMDLDSSPTDPPPVDIAMEACAVEENESGLTRQMSARTAEFMNHRKAENKRAELRSRIHRQRIDTYGPDAVVIRRSERFQTGMSDTIGHRRTMEDCMTLCGCLRGRPDEDLLAVFDGHGGQAVAEFCAMLICVVVQEILAAGSFSSMADFWYQVFHQLNNQVEQELGEEAHDSGATAAIALIQQDTVHVANVGDSRAVLGRDGIATRLTFDHKPGDEGEKARIEAAGGTVVYLRGIARLDGNLAVARSFGDLAFAPRLSVDPYTASFELTPTDYVLIVACDGLWDVVSDQQSVDYVHRVCSRGGSAELAAAHLRDTAYEAGSTDNISVSVTLLRPIPPHPDEVIAFFSTTMDGKLGIIFGDQWPCIKRITDGSLAAVQQQLSVGMRLLAIDGTSVEDMSFDAAKPLVKKRPLELVFSRV